MFGDRRPQKRLGLSPALPHSVLAAAAACRDRWIPRTFNLQSPKRAPSSCVLVLCAHVVLWLYVPAFRTFARPCCVLGVLVHICRRTYPDGECACTTPPPAPDFSQGLPTPCSPPRNTGHRRQHRLRVVRRDRLRRHIVLQSIANCSMCGIGDDAELVIIAVYYGTIGSRALGAHTV
mgnify:CR=1 FL=1